MSSVNTVSNDWTSRSAILRVPMQSAMKCIGRGPTLLALAVSHRVETAESFSNAAGVIVGPASATDSRKPFESLDATTRMG